MGEASTVKIPAASGEGSIFLANQSDHSMYEMVNAVDWPFSTAVGIRPFAHKRVAGPRYIHTVVVVLHRDAFLLSNPPEHQ
jgi:hypothetical protein